jgi:hypothetical protein
MSRIARAICLTLCVLGLPGHFALAQEIRDPMRPPEAVNPPVKLEQSSAPPLPSLDLQAIRISGEQRTAIINGMTVTVGDVLAGARVVRIEQGSVGLLTDQSEFLVLRFVPDGMLTPTKTAPK